MREAFVGRARVKQEVYYFDKFMVGAFELLLFT